MRVAALAALSLFLSLPSYAGHAIYKSISHQKQFGGGKIRQILAKGFLVYNPDTNRGTAIAAFTLDGLKLFSVVEIQNHRVDKVNGSNGSTYTIISKAESPGTQFAGVLAEAVSMRGKDAAVVIDSAGTRTLPKVFVGSGRTVVRNDQTGITVAGEAATTFSLDVNASRASNLSESHDDAVTRFKNYFITLGYTQFSPAPAD